MVSSDPKISRRELLAGVTVAGMAPALDFMTLAHAQAPALRATAQRGGLFWGAAVQSRHIRHETDFAKALVRECSVIVPEWEMKWAAIEPDRGRRNFRQCDVLLNFASEHQLKCRGHTLIWHRSIPDWAKKAFSDKSAWSLVESHFDAMLGRYKDNAFIHWDVLNEVIEPKDGRDDALRIGPFLSAFGPEYIPRALVLAHERAPAARLYINEYGLDYDGKIERARRDGLLGLVERLKKANTPLHGVGIQAHLRIDNSRFSEQSLRRFLAELAAHDLEITLTELDVREGDRSLPTAERDHLVAQEMKRYLEVVLDEPAVVGIVTWGLSDRYSWLNAKLRHGLMNRGLPLDESLAPKPVKYAIVEALARRVSR